MVGVDRLGDVVARSGRQALLLVAGHGLGRDGDDGQVGVGGHRPDRRRGRVAVHLRHHHVHQDEVDLRVGDAARRCPCGRSRRAARACRESPACWSARTGCAGRRRRPARCARPAAVGLREPRRRPALAGRTSGEHVAGLLGGQVQRDALAQLVQARTAAPAAGSRRASCRIALLLRVQRRLLWARTGTRVQGRVAVHRLEQAAAPPCRPCRGPARRSGTARRRARWRPPARRPR